MPTRDYFTPRPPVGPSSRRLPRVRTELIRCELGEVLNLSMLGMRVRNARLKTGDEHVVTVIGFDMSAGPIHATVIWVEDGEAGLRFNKAPKTVRKALSDLAMLAREKGAFLATHAKSRRKS